MERITISIEPELATVLDELTQKNGYSSRSEALRDLIRGWHSQEALRQDDSQHCIAHIGYVYNHHDRTMAERISNIAHEHHHLTVSSMHLHLDHENCLEVAFLRGGTQEVRQFANRVVALTGVRHGSVSIVPVTMDSGGKSHTHGDGSHHVHLQPSN
jgi:CopG family transcriptional regulator, nickel-responsive regulator